MIVTVLMTRLVLKINVLTHATSPNLVVKMQFVRPHHIDRYVVAHQIGLVILIRSVINVGYFSNIQMLYIYF